MKPIHTKRLILRPWRGGDLELFAGLNRDPRVMEFFPSTLSREESDRLARRISSRLEERGWGFWAAEVPGVADFIGMIGLSVPSFEAHFTPAVEIGWRLSFDFWGRGYATEGALAALEFGFETLKLEEIVSFTPRKNLRSLSVMKRLGMFHDPEDDFDHPGLPQGSPLSRHLLYRLQAAEWKRRKSGA